MKLAVGKSVVFLIFATFARCALRAHPNSHQKSVLQNTVKALLDFKRLPKPGEVIRPLSKTGNAASKYMRKLFKAYQGSNGAKLSQQQGNIVRSISPALGVFNGEYVLMFNLHTVKPTEEIIHAEIHYNLRSRSSKRRYWKNGKRRHIEEIRCIVETPVSQIQVPKRETTADWLAYDARNVVESIIRRHKFDEFSSSQTGELSGPRFALKFERVRKNGSVKRISAENALRRHTPFLLLRSNDPVLINKEQVMSALYDATPADGDDEQDIEHNRVRRAITASISDKTPANGPQSYYSYHVAEVAPKNGRYTGTYRSENADQLTLNVRAFQSQGPELLQTRKEKRKQRKLQRKSSKKFRHRKKGHLPYPEDYKMPKFGTRDIVRPGDPKSNDIDNIGFGVPNQPTVVLLGNDKGVAEGQNSACAKHNLIVEFEDIGWGQWIIAPKSFEGHYCGGICPFPLTPESNPSNHATIQSIIHAIGLHPYVPAVCCAPDKMDSLTLLYFDEDDNVVLKNYPQMTVTSCGCL